MALAVPLVAPAAAKAAARLHAHVDGVAVSLRISGSGLSHATLVDPEAGDGTQQSTATSTRTGTVVSVQAVPFGFRAVTLFSHPSASPIADNGKVARWRSALRSDLRRANHGRLGRRGPVARLFGHRVRAIAASASLPAGTSRRLKAEAFWLAQAGRRIWIVSVARPIAHRSRLRRATRGISVRLTASGLSNPTTIRPAEPMADFGFGGAGGASWWQGACDSGYYNARAGRNAYPLGGSFLGVQACGPRPYFDGVKDVWRTAPGFAAYEWECVEYAMRFMNQIYGVPTYRANGSQVVVNYHGSRLVKVNNGTPGVAPQPGDVLAEGATSGFGHTAVVSASAVNGAGNGSITVVEENNSPSGTRTLSVSGWHVNSSPSATTGWLHDPTGYVQQLLGAATTPPPPTSPAPQPTSTPAPTATPAPGATPAPTAAPPRTWSEQEGHYGVNTFTNYHNASGMGPRIGAGAWVAVSCKVYDPTIGSVNPDGYWYRIATAPWNNAYYSPANTFMNGDPWGGPYTHNTDFAVPNC